MKKHLTSILLLLLPAVLIIYAPQAVRGASAGLILWFNQVLPVLFPFALILQLIMSVNALSGISCLTAPIMQKCLHLSPACSFCLLAGFLCGFPMGTAVSVQALENGLISRKEAQLLSGVCNHASPMFLLGYVYPLFHGNLPLWKLLAAVYGPALLLALPARLLYRNGAPTGRKPKMQGIAELQEIPGPNPPSPNQSNPGNLSADEAILSSVEVLCRIGGLLILFSIAVEFLRGARQLPAGLRLFLMGAMEMTTGIRELAAALPYPYSAAAACASLTFGGLSGIFQTKAALGALAQKKKAGLSIRQYCAWKLLYACLTAAILLTLEA